MKKSAFLTIYETIRDDILSGRRGKGTRLPVETEMASEFNVSIGTLRRATDKLELEGYLRREQGRGTFVSLPENASGAVSRGNTFEYGVYQVLSEQQHLVELIFGDARKNFTVLPSPLDIAPSVSPLYQKCSLVQLPVTLLPLPGVSDYLAPLPENLAQDIPEELLPECRSVSGELRLLPIICNPTVCYCWKPGFKAAGIPLPNGDWDFDEFFALCASLKKNNMPKPFMPQMNLELLYSFLFRHFGGGLFTDSGRPWLPEDAFTKTVETLRQMETKGLLTHPYEYTGGLPEFFNKPRMQLSFYGPWPTGMAEHPKDWHICSLPEESLSQVVFGLGIPYNAPAPDAALELLRSLSDHRLKNLVKCAPASLATRKMWVSKLKMDHGEVFLKPSGKESVLSGRFGFELWKEDFSALMNDAVTGVLPAKKARKEILRLLQKKRIHTVNSNYFA